MECINRSTCQVPFILTATIRQTTPTLNHLLYQPAVSACTHCDTHYFCMLCQLQTLWHIHLLLQGKFLHSPRRFPSIFCLTWSRRKLLLLGSGGSSQFEHILMMLKDGGTIPQGTLHSQDAINLGDIHFCPILRTLSMQCISLDGLCTLHSEVAFMPPQSNTPPELSGTTAILLVFQADREHERIINVYVGLVVCQVDSHLYSPSQINDFIQDIEGSLQAVRDASKAGHNPGKRHAYCLFVDNLNGVMSTPTNPPYCLVYPTSYVKGIEPNHFDTQNSPTGMHLNHCVCRATLHFSNEDPKQRTKYGGSCLIVPHGAQYNDRLYPTILEPWNHHGPLIDPLMGEPCPMEDDLAQLRRQKVYLPTFQKEIPVPPPHPTNKVGSQWQPSNPHTGWQLQTCPWSPPRLDVPAARVGLHGAQDEAPIPLLQSALIPCPPRNPLIPRNQPQITRQSPHRLQFQEAWPLAFSHRRVGWKQVKASQQDSLQYG